MTENSPNSAEGVQDAAAVAKNFVEEYQDNEWQRVIETKDKVDSWKIKYQTDEAAAAQSVTVEKETGHIVDSDLAH